MVESLDALTLKMAKDQHLLASEVCVAAQLLASAEVSDDEKLSFLHALGSKGETSEEVAAFAEAFKGMARVPDFGDIPKNAIDVCGTGGDGAGTFNISTVVGFVLAASGVPVIKHGNRSITSKCGSADMLEALGFDLTASDARLREMLEVCNFTFLFAPNFHPAFKHIAPVRKQLASQGLRSVFNILGPMINPASPAYQLLGVFSKDWCERMGLALNALGLKRGLVVHCSLEDGRALDELTCAGQNIACGAGDLSGQAIDLRITELGLDPCGFDSLLGGELSDNMHLLERFLMLETPQGLTDTIFLNAGAGLWVAGRTRSLREGIEMARAVVETGKLGKWLHKVKTFNRS